MREQLKTAINIGPTASFVVKAFSSQASQLALILLASTVLLDGCGSVPTTEDKPVVRSEPRVRREHDLQTTWRGRPYNALLEAYGSPKMVMNVPGYRPVKTSVVVYGVVDRSTQCIDTFTVATNNNGAEPTILDYFCR